MILPLQITFRGIPHSDAVTLAIRKKAAKLDRFSKRMTSCRVMVDVPHHRHHQGNLYRVHVDVTFPRGEIVAMSNITENHAHEDVYVAIRDAFNAMTRRLEDAVRRLPHRRKKRREVSPHGRVSQILWEDGGYGFIETVDGREIYFHSHSVLNARFGTLKVGTEVRYLEESGEEGPQASTVEVVGNQGKHWF